jgi:hypothetical protein
MRRLQWILLALSFSIAGAAWADPPDPCCVADVNGDTVVDDDDLLICSFDPPPPECDFDGDTGVGVNDFAFMSVCWETTCASGVPSFTPSGAGLTAGVMAAAAAWACRRR